MARDTIRFGVGSVDALYCSVWKMWVRGNDIYLLTRYAGGFMKVSLHKTGDWRVAFTEQSGIDDPRSPGRREIYQWRRPNEFTSGWTQCLHIMVPFTNVRRRFKTDIAGPDIAEKEIDWVPPPQPGHKVTFTVLISAAHVGEDAWEAVCRPGDATLGSLPLSNGERVWLMIRWEPMSDDESQGVKKYIDTMRIDYKSDPGEVFAEILEVGEQQPYPILLNFALGYEHVFVQGKPMA